MAKQTVEDSFTFVGGLNTEGGFLLTPKNSWKEGVNFVPKQDGSIERRPGLTYEANYKESESYTVPYMIETDAYTVGMWESVGGDGNLDFFVVQIGSVVRFYKAGASVVSETEKQFYINLGAFTCFGNTSQPGTSRITTASCYGKLVITSKDIDPILVTYDAEADTIKALRIKIQIRDFEGIRSPVMPNIEKTQAEWEAVSFWPHALYNLYNQGWKNKQLNEFLSENSQKYPANTKQWIYGKNTDDDFDADVLAKQDFGTSPAPKGRFILEAFYQDRNTAIEDAQDADLTTLGASVIPLFSNFNFNRRFTDSSEFTDNGIGGA